MALSRRASIDTDVKVHLLSTQDKLGISRRPGTGPRLSFRWKRANWVALVVPVSTSIVSGGLCLADPALDG